MYVYSAKHRSVKWTICIQESARVFYSVTDQ